MRHGAPTPVVSRPVPDAGRRVGFTLIEMLVIIALLGTLTLIGGRIITLFMEVDASVASDAVRLLNLERLEDRFRLDVHAASAAEVVGDPGGETLLLSNPDAADVRYVIDGDTIVRRTALNGRRARDRFTLAGATCRFEIADPLVRLILLPQGEVTEADPRERLFANTLGRGQQISALLHANARDSVASSSGETE